MLLFILGIIALIVGGIIAVIAASEGRKGGAISAGVVGAIICAALILMSCVAYLPTGNTGIVTTFGKVENYTLDAGLNFKAPWQKVVKMDNRTQKESTELKCFSSDIQEVSMVYTINYRISESDAMTIYSTIGKSYYETVVAPCITESVKSVAASYTAEELISQREQMAYEVEEKLAVELLEYNIILISTSVEDMDFTDAFTNAVEAKQVAQQNKLKAETEAEQKVIEAEAQARVKKVNADAAAYELLTKAEAEAKANKMLSESLTDRLIDYEKINRWDGKLPTYMMGESTPMIDLG